MKRSTSRILTTHVGSLAQPAPLTAMIQARDRGEPVDDGQFEQAAEAAVRDIVSKQVERGLTVVNDGEMSKSNYTNYVTQRMTGFGDHPEGGNRGVRDWVIDFPEYAAKRGAAPGDVRPPGGSACLGPVSWSDFSRVEKDIANLRAATQGLEVEDVFVSAVSPGQVPTFIPNFFYSSKEEYIYAMADLLKREYEAIVAAGFTLQLDCPELAMSRRWHFASMSDEEFRSEAEMHIEALNYATRDIAPEDMRIHVCWGRPEVPHTGDVPLRDIVGILCKARPAGIGVVGANGRHEFEWVVWQETKLPDGKYILPGVIDNTTNIVEHPETVADRIKRYAGVVGRENVIASVDCGFGNQPGGADVVPTIAWAKLRSLAEGAEMASAQLWKK